MSGPLTTPVDLDTITGLPMSPSRVSLALHEH